MVALPYQPVKRRETAAINRNDTPRRSRSDGRPTISDVAAHAGVGAITVSRALRSPHLVSLGLRESIEKAVQALNYVPDQSARALASARTDVVGLLLPSLTHMVFTDVLRGIFDGIEGTKLQVQLGNTRYDPQEEERLIALFTRQRPAAMIVSGVEQTAKSRRMLERAGCPVVQIMDLTADPIDQVIGFSHEAAGRLMTGHLIEQGYRRIAFLSGWLSQRANGRLLGYRQALAAADLDGVDRVFAIDLAPKAGAGTLLELATPAMGRKLLRQVRHLMPDTDAVFCNNDMLALGVLFECHACGIRVPDDLGIAGFNDLDFADSTEPGLSTVRTHRWRIGNAAITTIRERLEGQPRSARIVDLGVDIVQRRSTLRRSAGVD